METIGKGAGDDEAFRGLMELELSGFGAEEGDSLHLGGRGGKGADGGLGGRELVPEGIQIIADGGEAELAFGDGDGWRTF